ncbi:hypothetical protein G6F56_010230 [Rhizopus delemar]|nr:hypothetical protein G6F56_010230 [Rhizopus delemar]
MDPAERYKSENVLVLAISPGPKKPTDLMSFLEPIYAEINELGERDMVVNKDGVELYRCKVHLVCNTGDIPGIAQLMNHDGCRVWSFIVYLFIVFYLS